MTCAHCYAETFRHVEPIALPMLHRALDEFYELGVFHYVLQGGEPITDLERLEFVLAHCHPDESYINVVSNGWHMTPERVAWLRERQVDKVAFSLDSGRREEHDAGRGAGSFDRVMAGIEAVLAAGLLASISTVVTRQSLYSEGFQRAYSFAEARGIRIDVQIAEPVGRWDGRKDLLMRPEDSRHIAHLRATCPVLPNGQVMVNRDIYSGEHDHCPAGTEFMALTTDGQVLPCNFLHYSLGRVGERPIAAMRAALLTSPWFDGRHPNCICGEDDQFIDSFIVPYVGQAKPLDAYRVFSLEEGRDATV
jgi:MoaA/NifB/PqqE/SkfB family radical SAM enzyme